MKRRDLLKRGAAAMGGAAVAATGAAVASAQTGPNASTQNGRRFRAFVRTPAGAAVRDVRMSALRDDMVVTRS